MSAKVSTFSRGGSTTTVVGEITRELVNASDGQGLHFAEGGYIDLTNAAGAEFGTSDFTIEFILDQDGDNTNDNYIYLSQISGNNRVYFYNDISANDIKIVFVDNSGGYVGTTYTLTYDMSADYGTPTHYALSFDRSGSVSLYKNAAVVATTSISGASAIDLGASNTAVGRIGDSTGGYTVLGTFYRFRTWNKSLSSTEVTDAFENSTVPFADQWGKEVYTSDFSSNVDGWGGFSATSSGNNDSISDGTTSKNDCLKTYAQAASSTHGITQTFGTLLAGTVTVKLDYLIPGPSFPGTGGGNTKVDGFKVENTTTSTVVRTESTLDVWTSIEFTATSAGGDAFKIFMLDGAADSFAGANDANDDRIFFKNIEINNRGCVSDYDCAFSNPSVSRTIQDRAGAADGTSSASGVTQVTKIEAVNTNKLNVGGTVTRVGIGLDAGDAPSVPLHIKNAGGSYDEAIIALESGNNGITEIQMGDVSDIDIGNIKYSNINNSMSFTTNAATALTIDSDGAVNINSGTVPAGQKLYVRCASGSNLAIGDASGTVKFSALTDNNGANVPMEFGASALSFVGGLATFGSGISVTTGGVKFPATQSASADANVLDDYEEGTHVATLTPSTSGTITLNGSYDTLAYTKIGNLVHVQGYLEVSSVSSPVGRFDISLPFAIASDSPAAMNYVSSTVAMGGVASANVSAFVAFGDSSTVLRVYLGDGTNVVADSAQEVQANTNIRVSFQYKAA